MKILLVGAGAVGKVYGWHLARGGCRSRFSSKTKCISSPLRKAFYFIPSINKSPAKLRKVGKTFLFMPPLLN